MSSQARRRRSFPFTSLRAPTPRRRGVRASSRKLARLRTSGAEFNRLSVLDGLRSIKELLKRVPNNKTDNGVALFVGGGLAELVFPPQPLKRPLYQCGKGFELEPLLAMLADDESAIGVVVIDGQSAVFARASGPHGEGVKVLKTITTHNRGRCRRGGQSALRFDRIRDQVEAAFVCEAAEVASSLFGDGGDANEEVAGLILAGPANLKNLLGDSSALAKPLRSKVVARVETAQGGRTAIAEALRRGAKHLTAYLHAPESAILADFFSKLEQDDTSKLTYGIKETLAALEAHAVKKLLVSRTMAESTPLASCRHGLSGMASGVATQENGASRAAAQAATLAEFLLGPDGVAKSGAELVWIDVLTEDGVRFAEGFGGLGGYLHWPFEGFEEEEEEEEEEERPPTP
uniref:Eukaryotic peptide chain release factor subunit 1 n=1 Tax=Florenciella parvula TaxID=236787 RepID=A0A7S2B034_9STRA|mmetsp:Transcript_11541/g.24232  ORF Transcript_11541/g.24232 Transcript_11541/m.24232 type:complete len:404 (+) Transcript_11541:213-1424(+)